MSKENSKKELKLEPTIEELAEKNNIPIWSLTGAKRRYGWGNNKRMSEKEFIQKIRSWENGPMHRGE